MATEAIKVSNPKVNRSVEVNAPVFETAEQALARCADEASLRALEMQAWRVALAPGIRRILASDKFTTDEQRQTAAQAYVDEYNYKLREASGEGGTKKISAKAAGEKVKSSGVKFSEAQLEALRAAGIEV